jgi:hypothetical protein
MIRALIVFIWALLIDSYNPGAGVPLTRNRITNQAIGAGATVTMDVPCGGTDFVTVEADMTGAANGDLAITVVPYEADGNTLMGQTLPPAGGVGYVPTFAGGRVTAVQQYNVQGIDKVQVQFKNNNVGAQTITRASWRTQSW